MFETTRAAHLYHIDKIDTVMIRCQKRSTDGGFSPARRGRHVFECDTRHTLRMRCDIMATALDVMRDDDNASPALLVVEIHNKGEWDVLGAICEKWGWPTFVPRDHLKKSNAYNEAMNIAAEHMDRIVEISQNDLDYIATRDGVDIRVPSS
jgi:hypothetical protein